MKWFLLAGLTFLAPMLSAANKEDVESFLNAYAGPAYQDIMVQNQSLRMGTDMCHVRYEMIKPILDSLQGPFTMLDLGAAQGYFSLRVANDYPQSTCIMIGSNHSYYGNHGDMLFHLCHLNDHLSNITYLNKLVNLSDLRFLNQKEHFDVLLALLVIHQIDESAGQRMSIVKTLLQMADNVIIEVSNDVAPDLGTYVESMSRRLDCIYLGEVRRHNNLDSRATGKLFCFTKKKSDMNRRQGITVETFSRFNGVYPN